MGQEGAVILAGPAERRMVTGGIGGCSCPHLRLGENQKRLRGCHFTVQSRVLASLTCCVVELAQFRPKLLHRSAWQMKTRRRLCYLCPKQSWYQTKTLNHEFVQVRLQKLRGKLLLNCGQMQDDCSFKIQATTTSRCCLGTQQRPVLLKRLSCRSRSLSLKCDIVIGSNVAATLLD